MGTKDKLTKEGPTLVPLPAGVSTASNPIVKIATGRSHSLMLLANGEVQFLAITISSNCVIFPWFRRFGAVEAILVGSWD